jgi:DNA-binding NarL/FixJ family response regulator
MESRNSALIIANSAQLRDSLLVLLRAIPQIETVHQADDGSAALAMRPEPRPALVLLDYGLPQNEVHTTVRRIRAEWPGAHSVALIDDEQDRWSAEGTGVDVVVIKGVLAARLIETIEGLLRGGNHGKEAVK